MYIQEDFLQVLTHLLAEDTAKEFALCYVQRCPTLDICDKGKCTYIGLRLFFTDADLSEQWGDDWDDAPYEHNAGWPYDCICYKDKNGKWQQKPHQILVLNVSLKQSCNFVLPEDYGCNSPFSVETINQGACAWMFFGKKCKPIYAGATPAEVFERIGKWMMLCPETNNKSE